MSDEQEKNRAEICYEVLFGRDGHPEESLVVAVEKMSNQMKVLMKFGWTMVLLVSSLIGRELWDLMTHAG